MVSKMVTDRQKSAAALDAALATHAEEASANFALMLEPFVDDGGPVPDLQRFQGLLQRRLAGLASSLVDADEVHVSEQEGDQASRQERDDAVAEIRPLITVIRTLLEAGCGAGTCARLFSLTGLTPRDPVVLQRITRRMVNRFSSESFVLAEITAPGVQLDTKSWVAKLEPPLLRLEASLGRLLKEGRESIDTRLAKSGAMTEYDRAYGSTARILEELFRYVGLTDKADTMRPSKRTTGSVEDEPEPQTPPPDTDPLEVEPLEAQTQEASQAETSPPAPPVLFPALP